jgi:hypothetical protein
LRRTIGLAAAGAMVMALLPAGTVSAAHTPEARDTSNVCPSGNATDYESSFADVGSGPHWVNILCMADLEITEGLRPDGTDYGPRREVTRGQMASFIVRFIEDHMDADMPAGDPERFDDVPATDAQYVHATNIHKLAAADIVRGTAASDGGEFAPQRPVNRMQMGSFIRHALSWIDDGDARNASAPPAATHDWFPDPSASEHEANVDAIAEVGIVEGFADGTYGPTRSVLRDQMASFVMRAYDYAVAEGLGVDEDLIPVGIYKLWLDEDGEVIQEDTPDVDFTLTLSVEGEVLATLDQNSELPGAWAELEPGSTYTVAETDLAEGWQTVDCPELDPEESGAGDHSGVGTFELTDGGRHFVCNQQVDDEPALGNVVFEALLPVGGPFPHEMQSLDGASFRTGETIEDVLLAVENVNNPDEVELDLELLFLPPEADDWVADACEELFIADSCDLITAELDDGNPFTTDQVFFEEEQLTIPPDATTGEWGVHWQAVDGDDEVWFADTFTLTVKAQIQAEIHFETDGASFDGVTFQRGEVLEDIHLEVEIIDNPNDEALKLFYLIAPPGVMFPGEGEFCDELFTAADCAVLDGALADTNPITATTIYLDAEDGVDFTINDQAPVGDWMIAWGLHDEDLEVRGWSDAFFEVVE